MPPTIALIFMGSLLTFRLLTTVFHELGHAIPALLFTNEKVTIYLGSYGNPEKAVKFQLGRLECFFKFNLFYWKGGLCVMHEKKIPLWINFVVTISGPLLSFIIAGCTSLFLLYGNFSDTITLVLFALVFSCTLDFLHNIIPNQAAIELYDGHVVHNDGTQLLQIFKNYKIDKLLEAGELEMKQGNYTQAAQKFEQVLMIRDDHEVFYRLIIHAYLMIGDFEKAEKFQKIYTQRFSNSFEVDDFINLGNTQLHHEDYDNALMTFKKAQEKDSKNKEIQAYTNKVEQLRNLKD
ncbi:M50 family metallopeptidase [Kordia zhangzhouensis]|uniref:M50 family metallopeptidase n=1 Tax=Kordia zhangzhouensis TaxID=1620405 RepID=UPI0006291881|nr:M50 family metallopeptidase [Kordia zhangzhouensis]